MAMHRKHGAGLAVAVILVIIGIMAWMNSSTSAAPAAGAAKNTGAVPPAPLPAAGDAAEDWWANTQLWFSAEWARATGQGVTS